MIRARGAVDGGGAAELRGHHHHHVVHQASEVGGERGQRLADAGELEVVVEGLVGVGVEGAGHVHVDGARAQAGLDELGGLAQRVPDRPPAG